MTDELTLSQTLTSLPSVHVRTLREGALNYLVENIAKMSRLDTLTQELADEILQNLTQTTTVDVSLARLLATERAPITNIRITNSRAVISVAKLSNLTRLDASHTNLADQDIDTLYPLARTLKSLDVSHCGKLTYYGIIKLARFTQLESLYLEGLGQILNKPEHLVPLEELTQLRTISLADNPDLRRLPATQFQKLLHLQHLNVSHTKIDYKEIVRVVRKARSVVDKNGELIHRPKRGLSTTTPERRKRARLESSSDTQLQTQPQNTSTHIHTAELASTLSIDNQRHNRGQTHVPLVYSTAATPMPHHMPIAELHIDVPELKRKTIGQTMAYFPQLRILFLNQPPFKEIHAHFNRGCSHLRILGLSNWHPRPVAPRVQEPAAEVEPAEAPNDAEGTEDTGDAENVENAAGSNDGESNENETGENDDTAAANDVDPTDPDVTAEDEEVVPVQSEQRARNSAIPGIRRRDDVSSRARPSGIPGVTSSGNTRRRRTETADESDSSQDVVRRDRTSTRPTASGRASQVNEERESDPPADAMDTTGNTGSVAAEPNTQPADDNRGSSRAETGEGSTSRVGTPDGEVVEHDEDSEEIGQDFVLPETIHTLILHKCTIEDKVLIEILRANPKLRRLKIVHNSVVSEGLHARVSRVLKNLSLETVVLLGCGDVLAGDDALVYQRCTDDFLDTRTVDPNEVRWTEFRC